MQFTCVGKGPLAQVTLDLLDFTSGTKARSIIHFSSQSKSTAAPPAAEIREATHAQFETFDQLYNTVTEKFISRVIESE